METTTCVKAVVVAVNQYLRKRSDANCGHLERQLEVLNSHLSRHGSLEFFSYQQLLETECISCVVDLLNDQHVNPMLGAKCIQFFNIIGQDEDICRALHDRYLLCPVLSGFLKSNDFTRGPCLQLLQKITYGHRISFHETYMEDLLNFLVTEISGSSNEITSPCLGLLANFSRDNFSVQSFLKNHANSKKLFKVLIGFLSQDDFLLVVYSLAIITSVGMNEALGEQLFNANNIHQTFQLIFNILVQGDSGITRRYAVDYFKDILRNPRIQQCLIKYEILPNAVSQILCLLKSSSGESVSKVLELLLAFCSVSHIRAIVCKCFNDELSSRSHLKLFPKQLPNQITVPLLSLCHWAGEALKNSSSAPVYALELLNEIYEELIFSSSNDREYACHVDLVVPVIKQILGESFQGENKMIKKTCSRMVRGLKLLLTLCNEDEFAKVIASTFEVQIFSQLLEFQFLNNKLTVNCKIIETNTEDWSYEGVEVVLYTLLLMSKLKGRNISLQDLMTKILQDGNIAYFLAKGLKSDNREIVQITLQLLVLGSVYDDFPTVVLGDAIATNNENRTNVTRTDETSPPHKIHRSSLSSIENKENSISSTRLKSQSMINDTDASVQFLIEKIESNFEMKDVTSSEIIDVYQHKLQSLQTKEDHLQDLLDAKALALSQADRLLAQYRCRIAKQEAESSKMSSVLKTSENQSAELKEKLHEVKIDREQFKTELEQAVEEVERLQLIAGEHQELTATYNEITEKLEDTENSLVTCRQELKSVHDINETLQKHNETLKQQHDKASEQLLKLEEERKQLSKQLKVTTKQLKDKETALQDVTKGNQSLQENLKKTEKENEEMEIAIDKLRIQIGKAEEVKKQDAVRITSLEAVLQEKDTEIKRCSEILRKQREQLDKHSQIEALIHSLSSGKDPKS